jgi:hypothetical protein
MDGWIHKEKLDLWIANSNQQDFLRQSSMIAARIILIKGWSGYYFSLQSFEPLKLLKIIDFYKKNIRKFDKTKKREKMKVENVERIKHQTREK